MTRLGIITGLVREANVIARAAAELPEQMRPLIFCAGGSNARARAGAIGLAGQGVGGLVSFGVAGGLDPSLAAGDIVIADRVVFGTEVLAADEGWRGEVLARLEDCQSGAVVAVDAAVVTPRDKARLHGDTGARAVDMESGGVALAARDAGLPFLVVRAVIDSADQGLPTAAAGAMRADGSVNKFAIVSGLSRAPWQIPMLVRLARADKIAMARLGGVAARALPAFFLG